MPAAGVAEDGEYARCAGGAKLRANAPILQVALEFGQVFLQRPLVPLVGKCTSGAWVDSGFAKDWYRGTLDRGPNQTELPITLGSMRIGEIGLAFHAAELYSFYGRAIHRDSPFADTIVIGYADGFIGYLADPVAYEAGEYAATTVPKILDFPPFMPAAAEQMSSAIVELLQRTAG